MTGTVELDRLYGYAEGTTGGEGGKMHHFNDGKKFCEWLKLREKNEIAGLPEKVYVGLAANSANNDKTGTAVFSSFILDGTEVTFLASSV